MQAGHNAEGYHELVTGAAETIKRKVCFLPNTPKYQIFRQWSTTIAKDNSLQY